MVIQGVAGIMHWERGNRASGMDILNLPSLRVVNTEIDGFGYVIRAERAKSESRCAHCRSADIVRHGTKTQVFNDCSIHGHRAAIHLSRQRYRCKACGKTFSDSQPDLDDTRLLSRRAVNYIREQSLSRTFASLAREIGVDEKTVRNIFRAHVAELAKQVTFDTPRWLGIDEVHLTGQYRAVITNLEEQTVVELLPGRNLTSVRRYLSGLENKPKVELVAMDMWRPYRDAVQEQLPQARIIIDRWHVQRMANGALEMVRKALRSSLPDKERRMLKDDRYILLKRQSELNPEQLLKLSGWLQNYPVLNHAHALKEGFCSLWDSGNRLAALTAYAEWQAHIVPDAAWAFTPLVATVDRWRNEIFAYFDHPVTNAYTESLNNLIKLMHRIGRGYSFEALRAKILYTEGTHKTTPRQTASLRSKRREAGADNVMMYYSMLHDTRRERLETANYGASIEFLILLLESCAFY